MEAIFRNEAWGHMMVPVSPENEGNVCTSMAAGCEQALASYPTSLADDIRAMDICTDARQRLALHIRMVRHCQSALPVTFSWHCCLQTPLKCCSARVVSPVRGGSWRAVVSFSQSALRPARVASAALAERSLWWHCLGCAVMKLDTTCPDPSLSPPHARRICKCCMRGSVQGEKRALEATGDWFRRRASDLDSLEYYQERRLKRLGLLDDDGESTFEDMIQINM